VADSAANPICHGWENISGFEPKFVDFIPFGANRMSGVPKSQLGDTIKGRRSLILAQNILPEIFELPLSKKIFDRSKALLAWA